MAIPDELNKKLEQQALELASNLRKPVYVVENNEKQYSVTHHHPGSIGWRQAHFTWLRTVRPPK